MTCSARLVFVSFTGHQTKSQNADSYQCHKTCKGHYHLAVLLLKICFLCLKPAKVVNVVF